MRPPGSPRTGVPGRLHREAAGERPPRARPQRRGSPGPIPNPAVKPAFAESTAARGCGRAGRRARGGRFSMLARFRARGDVRRRAACAGRGPQGVRPLRASPRFADIAVLHRSRAKHAPQIPEGVVPLAGLPWFWEGCGIASGVARDAGRFMRREAPVWVMGSAPGCAEGCSPCGFFWVLGRLMPGKMRDSLRIWNRF